MSILGRATVLGLASLALACVSVPVAASEEKTAPRPDLEAILESWASRKYGNDQTVSDLLDYVTQNERQRMQRRSARLRGPAGPDLRSKDAKALRRLARDTPGVYVPIIRLYSEAHSLALSQGKANAAAHLRTEATRLLNEFLKETEYSAASSLGARFLVSLAVPLRETPQIDIARELLEDAVDLDPKNTTALFALAAIREKYGDYAAAAGILGRLLELDPVPEARLRRALCWSRGRKIAQAERELESLARDSVPDWVRAVAYQEWARLRLSQGDPDTALRLAREGQEAIPDDESLAILLAFLSGRRDPLSWTLTARLTTQPTGTGPTARALYNLWPPGVISNATLLDKQVAVRMPLLETALRRP